MNASAKFLVGLRAFCAARPCVQRLGNASTWEGM